jgi:hypothetical protein
MKRINSKFALLTIAVLIVALLSFWVRYDMRHQTADTEKQLIKDASFGKENLSWMKVDTFIQLITQAYHPNASTSQGREELVVQIQNANAEAQDFYNGNKALLDCSFRRDNFEIIFDKHNNNVSGRFKLKDGLVAVPNDVLIKAIYKTKN